MQITYETPKGKTTIVELDSKGRRADGKKVWICDSTGKCSTISYTAKGSIERTLGYLV